VKLNIKIKTFVSKSWPFEDWCLNFLWCLMFCLWCFGATAQGLIISGGNVIVGQAPTNALPEIPPSDALHFLDGSVLHGTLKSIEANKFLTWNHDAAHAPIQFKPDNLDRIDFKNVRSASTNLKTSCSFRFRNGDEVSGNLISLDANHVALDTWFGNNFKAPRDTLRSIAFGTRAIIYEGPRGLEGWAQGSAPQRWRYRDGMFEATGNAIIGRNLDLTGSAAIEFDLAWSGNFLLIVPIYTETIDRLDYSKSSYAFHIVPGAVSLQRTSSGAGGISIGNLGPQAQVPQMSAEKKARVEIRANKADATLEILINGQRANQWKDESGFVAKGTGIMFYAQANAGILAINNIRISEWNATASAAASTNSVQTNDVMRLANRDEVAGILKTAIDGKTTFLVGQKELAVPLQRITEIIFADAKTNALAANPFDVRASLAGSEKLSFRLQSWNDKEVRGTSATFGALTLDSSNVRKLEFNPMRSRSSDRDELAARSTGPAESDQLFFRNGDFLSGTPDGIDLSEGVLWTRSDAPQPLQFQPKDVSEIRFSRQSASQNAGAVACLVHLVNGDQIVGELVSVTEENISLEKTPAGTLKISRAQIETIAPINSRSAKIFSGPMGTNGWISGKITTVADYGNWDFREGAFVATKAASIARDLKLPDEMSFQFDLAWQGMLSEALALYTDYMFPVNLNNKENEPDFGAFYSLRLQNDFGAGMAAVLTGVKKIGPLQTFTNAPMPILAQKNSAHFEVRVSKPKALIALLVDGKLVATWTDKEFIGTGTGIRFVHQGLGTTRWSNLLVTEWDGQFEEPAAPANDRKQDIVKLRNGDKIVGVFESLADGKLNVEIAGKTKIQVPFNRLKQIDLAARKFAISELHANLRAQLVNRQNLTLQLDRWNKQDVTATHPILGKLKLSPASFEQVEFLGTETTNNPALKLK
jgi:hypothetical protein